LIKPCNISWPISGQLACELTKLANILRPAGFEPTAYGSGGRRSIQLSYGRDKLEDNSIRHFNERATI
jgi:hypothetical protein